MSGFCYSTEMHVCEIRSIAILLYWFCQKRRLKQRNYNREMEGVIMTNKRV